MSPERRVTSSFRWDFENKFTHFDVLPPTPQDSGLSSRLEFRAIAGQERAAMEKETKLHQSSRPHSVVTTVVQRRRDDDDDYDDEGWQRRDQSGEVQEEREVGRLTVQAALKSRASRGIEGFLQNLNMSGLASYIVNSAKIKLIGMKANIDINWPSITVSNNYSLKGNALNYDVYGNGDIDGIVHNFKTIIDIGFKMIGRYIQVQTIATKIFLEGLDFNVTGIYNNEVISETISKTISNVMPKLIAANQKTIEKMKLQVVFGLILICYNAMAMRINEPLKNQIVEDFLEKLKSMLETGNEKLGLPVLDPYKADQLAFDVNEDVIKLNANLSKVNANGLAKYNVINGDLDMSDDVVLAIHLSWPLVTASTDYAMKGKIESFEVFGDGNINLSAHNFVLNTVLTFLWDKQLTSYLTVKDIKLDLSLQKLDFKATGLFNDEETSTVLSAIVSEMAPELISDERITSKIIELVTKKLNEFLETKTVLEIIQMIL
ncbi:hypothetical protein ALC62_03963 [Cyphomyrmex costatus]|uniref:Uncharacterized protein n=2 Tax=Cyphomyrmex costatus TaxID=456900 RepID=A0A195CX84_9HYME|nr:hypothetical protein ALC62_03963 [Cyphomyrmex costatus]